MCGVWCGRRMLSDNVLLIHFAWNENVRLKKKNLYIYISLGFARYRILTHLSRLKFSPTDTSR